MNSKYEDRNASHERQRIWLRKRYRFYYLRFTIYCLEPYLRRPLENARSIEAMPPPEIKSARHIANNARGYSYPPLLAKKPDGQWIPIIAVSITQTIRKAPTRVSRPSKINMPPRSSENAAAPSHNQAGRMNGNGVWAIWPVVKTFKPGPA